MGQATTDLPNSKSKTASMAPEGEADSSADDLLSKIAGDEIDRLLAGSEDRGGADAERFDPVDVDPDAELKVTGVQEELDAILGSPEKADDVPGAPRTDAAALAQESGDTMQSQLDALFMELSDGSPSAAPREPNASEVVSEPTPVAPVADTTELTAEAPAPAIETPATEPLPASPMPVAPVPVVSEPSDVQASAERAALAAPIGTDDHAEPTDPDAPLPVYLKPLEILNSPFASMPEWFAETLGKVGIITSINAIAVIVYVIVFRSPPR